MLVAGLTIAFGESGGMSRKVVYIVVGGAGALGIAATMSGLFGVSAGLSL